MTATCRCLVVIPAYNEEASVGDVVRRLRVAMPGAPALVVDDGSVDRTAQEAAAAGAWVLTLPYNLGVGGAMRVGYKYALRHGYEYAVQLDADGQHDPADIPRLLDALGPADIVIGARFAGTPGFAVRGPRRWAMWLLARSVSRAVGERLTDATSGFRACNRKAMTLFARHYPVEYLGDTVEALLIAARTGLNVTQVPVTMHERAGGRPSSNPFRSTLFFLRILMSLVLARIRSWPAPDLTGEPDR